MLPNFLILSLALEITNLGNIFLNILGDHEFFLQKNAHAHKNLHRFKGFTKHLNYIHIKSVYFITTNKKPCYKYTS